MTPEEIAKLEAERTAGDENEANGLNRDGTKKAPSQETKRTEAERAAFSLKKNAERAVELGLDPAEILGVKTHIETNVDDEDNKPVTVGMLRDIQKKDAQKTSLQMAEEIADEDTRNNVKAYLSDRIKPSGDAESDFRLALAAASAPKNKQVLEEINRYSAPKKTASGGSAPAFSEEEFIPTPEEAMFMKPPYNLSKEKIIVARKQHAEKNK